MKKQKEYHPSMQPYLDGQVILFDKPLTWTSFDIIKKVRYQTRIAKVGHAGTLDPLATSGLGPTAPGQAQYLKDSGNVKKPSGVTLGTAVGLMNPFLALNYIIRSGPAAF